MPSRLLVAPALVALLAASGGTAGGPGRPSPAPEVNIVTTEYGFTLPATLPAGPTVLRLTNHGKMVHHVTLIRLEQGKQLADLLTALDEKPPLPAWAIPVGGPNAVDPGGSSRAIVDLQQGRYAIVCLVPDPDGKPHFIKGMTRELTVTASTAKQAPPTRPEMTVHLADYGFSYVGPLTAGEHHLRVHNDASQWHELVLVRLAPGKTAKDFAAWVEGGMKTPPPGSFQGGAGPLAPGLENEVVVDLRPGHYLMICFLEDVKDMKPHLMHGMIREVAVK